MKACNQSKVLDTRLHNENVINVFIIELLATSSKNIQLKEVYNHCNENV